MNNSNNHLSGGSIKEMNENGDKIIFVNDINNTYLKNSPYRWDVCDKIFWLVNISNVHNIPEYELNNLINHLTNVDYLCQLAFNYFITISPRYGVLIFEDLQMCMSN